MTPQDYKDYKDYIVECHNPKAFDQTINQMGAMLQQNADGSYFEKAHGFYIMRVLGNAGYVLFAIKSQGYGKVIGEVV